MMLRKPRQQIEESGDDDGDFGLSSQSDSEPEDDKGRVRRQIYEGGKGKKTSGGAKVRDRQNFSYEEIQRVIKYVADQREDLYMDVFGPQPKSMYMGIIADLLHKEGLSVKQRMKNSLNNRFANMGKQYEAYLERINRPGHGPIGIESMQEANERVLRNKEFRSIQRNFNDLHRIATNSGMRARYYGNGSRTNVPQVESDAGPSTNRNDTINKEPTYSRPVTTTTSSSTGKRKKTLPLERGNENTNNGPVEVGSPQVAADNEPESINLSPQATQPPRKKIKISEDLVEMVKTKAESEASAAMKRREAEATAARLAWEEEDRTRKGELRNELEGELFRLIRMYQTLTRQAEEALKNKDVKTIKDLTASSSQILDQIMRLS